MSTGSVNRNSIRPETRSESKLSDASSAESLGSWFGMFETILGLAVPQDMDSVTRIRADFLAAELWRFGDYYRQKLPEFVRTRGKVAIAAAVLYKGKDVLTIEATSEEHWPHDEMWCDQRAPDGKEHAERKIVMWAIENGYSRCTRSRLLSTYAQCVRPRSYA